MKSFNPVEEMRLRIVDNEIRLYDVINPTYIVMTESGVFENCGCTMFDNYKDFYETCHKDVENAKKQRTIKNEYNDNNYNVYYITCVP